MTRKSASKPIPRKSSSKPIPRKSSSKPIPRKSSKDAAYLIRLGAAIRNARESLGQSVNAAAQSAGIKSPTWLRIEAGQMEPSVGKMQRIAKALGLSLEDLLPPIPEKKGE